MKKANKLISILLIMVMMLTIAPISAFAATEAYQLNRDDYLECAYSENVTQYYRDNNYLYKATYSNLKNVAKVGICFDYSYELRLHYISSDGENSGYAILYKARTEVAKASDLPKSPVATFSCMSYYEKLYINKDKPVVTFTCLAVNAPVWTWNGTSSATAKFTSTDGKATMTVDATIESSVQPAANCLEKDKTVYTATATANGKAYTNEKTIYGEQGSHSFEYSGDDVIGRCTNGCGYECPHENQTGKICTICGGLTHKHSFVYIANGNVITATCSNADGYCNETNGGTLAISAPAELYTDGTISREAVIDNQLVEPVDYTVKYSTADGTAPKTSGTYTASVTVGGATASVEFTLSDYAAKVTDKDGNEIEGSPFKTLEEAADAVRWDYENATITLLDDITLDSMWRVGGVVTIDLNGKNLNCTSGDTIYVQAFNGFAVTVVDSSENKTGVIRSETGSAIDVGVGSKFILNSGTITAENDYAITAAYRDRNHSLLEVNGGTVNGVVMCYADSVVTGGTFNDMFAISYSYKQNKFSGGIFNGGIKITSFDPLNDLLADGYYFRNAQGKVVDGSSEIIEEKVTIEKGADFSADAVVTAEDVVYNGSAQEPDVTVTIGGKILTEGKDYIIAFADNINAGTATVTVTSAGNYEGEIVKTFEIKKADSSIDVYPEANKLTYNGEAQALVTAGSSENGAVVYSLDGEKYSAVPPTGTNAGEYTVYYKVEGDSNHNDSEPATVTVTIKAKDISDGFIILGDALTYNGTEQTQTVAEFVIPEDFEVTYTVSGNKATNVGVYLLTVTGTGNFTGEAKITFEIAVDMNGLDFEKTYPSNVKSTDRERIEYVLNQIENAESDIANAEKRTEWIRIKGECVELLKMIKSVADKLKSFKTDLAKYDIDTVTSDDYDYLERLQNTIGDFEDFYFDNLTDEQVKETSDIFWVVVKLQIRISEVAKEITRITNGVNGYDEVTVKSTDKADLEQLKTDIKALAEGQNLTDEEREHLAELDAKLDAILKKIADTKAEIDRVNEAVNAYDEETIKSTDSADLEQLKEDIQALIDSGNVTETEKTALEEILKDIEALEERITETEEKLEEIKGIESNYNPENVSSDDKAAVEEKIAEIEAVNPDNLTNEQKAEYAEIKAGFEALLEEIEKAGSEVDAVGTELEMFDEERVTIFHEDEIEVLKAKIDELLADENMGETEKAKLGEYKAQCDNLIEIINTPAKYFSMRLFHFVWDALHWLSSHVVFIFNWIIAMF